MPDMRRARDDTAEGGASGASITTQLLDQPCHGCGGKGWVTVQDPPEHVVSNACDASSDKSQFCKRPPIRINQ